MKKTAATFLALVLLSAFALPAVADSDWRQLIDENIWMDYEITLTYDHEQLFHDLGDDDQLYWNDGYSLYKLVTNGKDLIYGIDTEGRVQVTFNRYDNITDERILSVCFSDVAYNDPWHYTDEDYNRYYWQLTLLEDGTFTLSCASGNDVLPEDGKGFPGPMATGAWTLTDGKKAQLTLSSLRFLDGYADCKALENNPLSGCDEGGTAVFSWRCIMGHDWHEYELLLTRDGFSMTLWKDDTVWNPAGETVESVTEAAGMVTESVTEAVEMATEAVENAGEQ